MQGYLDVSLLLWCGVEMVEIFLILSMDIDMLWVVLFFFLVDVNVVSEDVLCESVGKLVVNFIYGVCDMVVICQLKVMYIDFVFFEQVDNVCWMLLVMVDDFCCVVIKLVECIVYLWEVKDVLEDECVLVVKECINIYVLLVNCFGIG